MDEAESFRDRSPQPHKRVKAKLPQTRQNVIGVAAGGIVPVQLEILEIAITDLEN